MNYAVTKIFKVECSERMRRIFPPGEIQFESVKTSVVDERNRTNVYRQGRRARWMLRNLRFLSSFVTDSLTNLTLILIPGKISTSDAAIIKRIHNPSASHARARAIRGFSFFWLAFLALSAILVIHYHAGIIFMRSLIGVFKERGYNFHAVTNRSIYGTNLLLR